MSDATKQQPRSLRAITGINHIKYLTTCIYIYYVLVVSCTTKSPSTGGRRKVRTGADPPMPPDEALRMLKEGNRRFVKGTPEAARTFFLCEDIAWLIKVVGIWSGVRTEGRHQASQFKATMYVCGWCMYTYTI